jgi:hypothetical protein
VNIPDVTFISSHTYSAGFFLVTLAKIITLIENAKKKEGIELDSQNE